MSHHSAIYHVPMPHGCATQLIAAVLSRCVQDPTVPTLWRCAFGHGRENATLPLGAVCAVDTERGTLELATPQECEAMWAAARACAD